MRINGLKKQTNEYDIYIYVYSIHTQYVYRR